MNNEFLTYLFSPAIGKRCYLGNGIFRKHLLAAVKVDLTGAVYFLSGTGVCYDRCTLNKDD